MKNITLSIDDETYRLSRIKAAEAGTSVSALVRESVHHLGCENVTTKSITLCVGEETYRLSCDKDLAR